MSKDDYIGVEYNKVIDIDSIRFLLGGGKDHFEHAKLQYMTEEGTWEDLTLTGMENNFAGEFGKVQDINVKEANLPSDLKAKGIGIIYISHRMDEIKVITDRVTVMRDGTYVGTLITKRLYKR